MVTIMDSIMELSRSELGSLEGCVMALEAGSASVRAVLIDEFGNEVASATRPLHASYPRPGWVEQDPVEILSAQVACMAEVQYKSGIHSDRILAVGIANQRESVVVWDKRTGQPIHNAIVWQCRRTAPEVERIVREGHADAVRALTGLVPDAYFSATKIAWLLDNVEGAREVAEAGELLAGTIDTWLVYNLTDGRVHATDFTNASRTMLFDIHKLDWNEGLCELFRVPVQMLPEPRPSSGDFGRVSSDIMTFRPPIAAVCGDQQASLFGHCCFGPGSVKATYGTGCFLLENLGPEFSLSDKGLITTVGIAEGGKVDYALEGSVFQAGSVVQWLVDGLGLIGDASEAERLARSVEDAGGCYVVPAFSGLGAPWWKPDARGVISGLTRDTDKARLVRAACESVAYQVHDVLAAMSAGSERPVRELRADGSALANDVIAQFQADILGIDVVRTRGPESAALGAAYLSGLAVGFWADREEVASLSDEGRRFTPEMDESRREALLAGWEDAVRRAL